MGTHDGAFIGRDMGGMISLSLSTMRIYSKKTICKEGREPSQATESASTLVVDF